MSQANYAPDGEFKTSRVTVRRRPQRGAYDFPAIAAILDATFLCHVGFAVEGQPYVIPTSFGRADRTLYFHGSAASRTLRHMSEGLPVCVTVTILDGLVLARSAFNHSMNYRSVLVLGSAKLVEGGEKLRALEIMSDHIIPGRWRDVRGPNDVEVKATSVLRIDLTEASAKVRSGPPMDDDEDLSIGCWAGVLPLAILPQPLVPDPRLADAIAVPSYISEFGRTSSTAGK